MSQSKAYNAPIPTNELERLKVLQSYNILDSKAEIDFDEITLLASQICESPVSLITMLDENRNWFKSKIGTPANESPREYAFCAHAIMNPNEPFIVNDTLNDERFKNSPLVTEEPNVRFYAGVPLVTIDGFALGTLCVIDVKAKELNDFQINALKTLAKQVMKQLDLIKKIVELENNQNDLLKSNSFQKSLIDSKTHFLVRLDPEGNYMYANKKFLDTFNLKESDIIGKSSLPYVFEGDLEIVTKCVEKCFEQPDTIQSCVFRKPLNGEFIWTEWEFLAIKNHKNEIIKIQCIGLDVNKIVLETQDLLLKNRALETAGEGIIISDLRKKHNPVTYVNKEFTSITGYTSEEVIDKNCKFLQGEESDKNKILEIKEAIRKRERFTGEIVNYRKDGTKFWNLLKLTPIPDENGNITHYVGVQKDITVRKIQELDLQKTYALTFNQNQRLNNFSYIISHNLRSHFSNFRALIDLIDLSSLDEMNKKIVAKMDIVSKQLNQTMHDLNDIINIQLKPNINFETLNISASINKIMQQYSININNNKIELDLKIPTDYTIQTNPAYFESIMYNFISNAIKYSKPDTINKIKILVKPMGNKTYIEISDEGIGINLEKHGDELFGLYKKFTDNTNSMGLGLFLAKNQIEALNGKISVDSELNIGTTFKIIL